MRGVGVGAGDMVGDEVEVSVPITDPSGGTDDGAVQAVRSASAAIPHRRRITIGLPRSGLRRGAA